MSSKHLNELPVTGYLGRFSCRPGQKLAAYVSVRDGGAYRATLRRVISGDPNPDGPGLRFEDLSHLFDRCFDGRRQPIHLGSYGLIPAGPRRRPTSACTWTVLVWAAGLPDDRTAVLSDEAEGWRVTLFFGSKGTTAQLVWPEGRCDLALSGAMADRQWYRLWLSVDPASGKVVLGHVALTDGRGSTTRQVVRGISLAAESALLFAATDHSQPSQHFTGKLEAPAVLEGFVPNWLRPAEIPADIPILAKWDFAQGIDGADLIDTGPQHCHGRTVNLPTRAMVGSRWSGAEHCWRHAPDDYGAIYFHDDDLDDCRWSSDFEFVAPDNLPSGAYALHLTCATGEDWLPFYIIPHRHGPHAPIAFLASTFTYQAYANHARGNFDQEFRNRAKAWGASPNHPDDHPIYGVSTYNRHRDGTGVAYSSRLRPILTMRPGFLTFNDKRGSGLRHYPADTHLLAWLDAKGFAYDIVTDEDLDDEGVDLLTPYRGVITGSHPEYHTLRTLDALQSYVDDGGRFAYLGGNGFYWRIARNPQLPGVIEVRRAESGVRAWAAESGEYYHAIDGQLGGLWRANRRPPQMLAGIGFSAQGLFEGSYFRRLPESYDPAHAWIFEGIEGSVLGDYGLSGGGAAGFELDRADTMLGTPRNAVILARSENLPASFFPVFEDILSHLATIPGEKPEALRRGEIVYFETAKGGAVFSVGSITFCGSLWNGSFDGPVSRLLENVVRRFGATANLAPPPDNLEIHENE